MMVGPDSTPPPPPEQADKHPIRPRRIWTGIGVALSGHLLTILIGAFASLIFSSPGGGGEVAVLNFVFIAVIGQVILAIAALGIGIFRMVKGQDGGVGVGIIVGWAVGLIISPVVAFGVGVSLVNSSTGGMLG
jgi:hypothetical protein